MAEEDKILPVGQQALAEIQRHILLLRGKQVLLDFQLAAMYGVETGCMRASCGPHFVLYFLISYNAVSQLKRIR